MKTPPICNYEGSDYQESFWEHGNRAYEDAAEEIALTRLLPIGEGHLLELGAGAGRNTLRYHGFKKITLLDYSTTQLKRAIERLGTSSKYCYVAADIYRLPFAPGVFSAATMIRTLHHLSEPLSALKIINTCLFNNAIFILEFSNKRNIKSILRYWMKKQDWNPFSKEPFEFTELNFDFHPERVKEWIKQSGFMINTQIAVSYMRAGFLKRIIPLPVMRIFEHLLQRTLSWAALSPSIFLKAQASNQVMPAEKGIFFRCPACGNYPLSDTPPLLTCKKCGHTYPVKDGIYDFRLNQ
ncbi:MAG: methyltransferase domain-containing protein [Anaerolineaceae bacterium]|nr:methyltransferase domain-containing protein [Anaerolineaceae bacterium]